MVGSDDKDYILGNSGGTNNILIKEENVPTFNVAGETAKTGSGYSFTYGSSSRTTNTTGNHMHTYNNGAEALGRVSGSVYGSNPGSPYHYGFDWVSAYSTTNGNHYHSASNCYITALSGVEAHTHSLDMSYSNTEQKSINIVNEYIVSYIYVRIK